MFFIKNNWGSLRTLCQGLGEWISKISNVHSFQGQLPVSSSNLTILIQFMQIINSLKNNHLLDLAYSSVDKNDRIIDFVDLFTLTPPFLNFRLQCVLLGATHKNLHRECRTRVQVTYSSVSLPGFESWTCCSLAG